MLHQASPVHAHYITIGSWVGTGSISITQVSLWPYLDAHRDVSWSSSTSIGPYQDFDSFLADFDVQILILSSKFSTNFGPLLKAQAHANFGEKNDSGPVKFAPDPDPLLLAACCSPTRSVEGLSALLHLSQSESS